MIGIRPKRDQIVRIVLFDDILERHVRRSLGRALRKLGHEVVETPPIWKGHLLPETAGDLKMIRTALEHVLSEAPDILLNFRAATLTPDMLKDIRSKGVRTFVWLPDDPVLYNVCYEKIVDHYDCVLNCGTEKVLRFYEERHRITGVNFPFWTDNIEFPRLRDLEIEPEYDIVFLGNITGPVRRDRYGIIAGISGNVRIFGRVNSDPENLCHGYLQGEKEVATALGKARLGLNIPQFFSDYCGQAYDFPELADFGSFQFPSRVVQYAAIGLPILTYGRAQPPGLFPEMLVAENEKQLSKQIDTEFANPDQLNERARDA